MTHEAWLVQFADWLETNGFTRSDDGTIRSRPNAMVSRRAPSLYQPHVQHE
jgi:hypothetical protein